MIRLPAYWRSAHLAMGGDEGQQLAVGGVGFEDGLDLLGVDVGGGGGVQAVDPFAGLGA